MAKNVILLLAVVMLMSCGNALRLSPQHEEAFHEQTPQISNPSNFDFLVFCPATDADFQAISGPDDKRRFRIEFNPNEQGKYLKGRTYIIRAESTLKNGNMVLQYCGRLRSFSQYCNESIYGCTDGPMFDIEARRSIDVIWINNINSSNQVSVDKAKNTCMDPTFEPHKNYCSLKCKTRSTMTFNDPTIHPDTNTSEMRISYTTWPISTHVHGGEIRPAFDGNPLSWIINNPQRKEFGVGMFSLSEKCYFDSFEQGEDDFNPPIIKIRDNAGNPMFNFKVNRYPNKQNPGTLWYHDHAMRLTNFNVQYGLAGFYILRDTNVQKYLGIARENEKFILITNRGAQKYDLDGLVAGTVYRFRILNANYEGRATFRYSFSYNKCNKDAPDLEKFTIIGADSSLFDYGIENQTHFVVSNGERIDLIIKLGEGKTSFSVCGDTDLDTLTTPALITKSGVVLDEAGEMSVYNIKAIALQEYDKGLDKNTRTDINNIDLSKWVAYTDLSKMTDDQIAVKRFRPLMSVGTTDTINGRIDFHSGFSENPVIGSTEDWYMINTFPFGHPMHIHLINFQVIKVFKLLVLKSPASTCSFYEIDYVLKALNAANDSDAGVASFKANVYQTDENGEQTVNLNYTCDNLNAIKTNYEVLEQLSLIYPENEVDDEGISGLDLFAKDENDQYKYVVDGAGTPSPKAGYSKWKDTVYIDGFKVLQCRTRWTKPEYKEEVDAAKGTYFHVPADQMREYPGFVYHCHILPHEDNEMMRPIMLQMPDDGREIKAPCPQLKWEDKVECINKRCENAVKA